MAFDVGVDADFFNGVREAGSLSFSTSFATRDFPWDFFAEEGSGSSASTESFLFFLDFSAVFFVEEDSLARGSPSFFTWDAPSDSDLFTGEALDSLADFLGERLDGGGGGGGLGGVVFIFSSELFVLTPFFDLKYSLAVTSMRDFGFFAVAFDDDDVTFLSSSSSR